MAIIPSDEKVFMVDKTTNTTFSGSKSTKAMQQWYTMQDIIDSIDTGGGLEGTSYVYITGNGTDLENYNELTQAISDARSVSPYGLPLSQTNRFTIILGPGTYGSELNDRITLTTQFVDLVTLTGEKDAFLPSGCLIDTGDVNVLGIYSINNAINISSVSNVNIKNCSSEARSSFGASDVDTELINCTFENCTAGETSFGSVLRDCTFINCEAGDYSFGYTSNIGVLVNCRNNYFKDCKSGTDSFFSYNEGLFNFIDLTNNEFFNCKAGGNSFCAVYSVLSNVLDNKFKNCEVDFNGRSFVFIKGGESIVINNSFDNCKSDGDNCFISHYQTEQGNFSITWTNNKIDNCSSSASSFLSFERQAFGSSTNLDNYIKDNTISNCYGKREKNFISSNGNESLQISGNYFINCISDSNSFVFTIFTNFALNINNNKFINCTNRAVNGFCSVIDSNVYIGYNEFIDCNSDTESFMVNNDFAQSFECEWNVLRNCKAGFSSFGFGLLTITLNDCEFYNCVAKSNSFGCEPVNMAGLTTSQLKFFNCIGGDDCFGRFGTSSLNANCYYCKTGTSFPAFAIGYFARLCLDGSENIINEN